MSVGLDIGSKTIKIIELSKDGNGYRLLGSGIVGYSNGKTPDMIEDEREMAELAQVIKKLHAEAKIGSKHINVSLPESLVFTRNIAFPLLTDQEIDSAVKWEAEQYIPIPVAEAVIQHTIIERRENVNPPSVSVLLLAAPKALVEKYVKIMQIAGLNVTGVETELMSLSRSLAPVDKTVLLLDFGAKSTDIAIVKTGNLVFSRSIPTAGDAFTRAVSQALGVEINQAEEYKRAYGLTQTQLEGKISNALGPVFNIVADEIKKAIHFYLTEQKGEAPVSIVISGGTAGLPEALPFLSRLLGVEVVLGNPFSKVKLSEDNAKILAPYAPLYSIAVGLAMRE